MSSNPDMSELLDLLMDRLGPSTQAKVLAAIDVDGEGNVWGKPEDWPKAPRNTQKKFLWLLPLPFVLVFWTIPLVLVGCLMCLTIVLAMFGVPLVMLGAIPLAFITGKVAGA